MFSSRVYLLRKFTRMKDICLRKKKKTAPKSKTTRSYLSAKSNSINAVFLFQFILLIMPIGCCCSVCIPFTLSLSVGFSSLHEKQICVFLLQINSPGFSLDLSCVFIEYSIARMISLSFHYFSFSKISCVSELFGFLIALLDFCLDGIPSDILFAF